MFFFNSSIDVQDLHGIPFLPFFTRLENSYRDFRRPDLFYVKLYTFCKNCGFIILVCLSE